MNRYVVTAKIKNLIRVLCVIVVVIAAWHLIAQAVPEMPIWVGYAESVPTFMLQSEGRSIYNAGHLIPLVVAAVIAWFV